MINCDLHDTTQPVSLLPLCVCWMWGREGGREEQRKRGRWRSKQKSRWRLEEHQYGCVQICVHERWGVCLVFYYSCAFLWEAETRREGLAVQCLFSIRLLSLGRQLLSQLLLESPWQHLPLWAGRKTMPNIRKKQNHCLHMSRDCPPLVSLLWPMIANLCKTIPVAKEEGALERNTGVRAQFKSLYSVLSGHCRHLYIHPDLVQHTHTNGPGQLLFSCCHRLWQPFWK